MPTPTHRGWTHVPSLTLQTQDLSPRNMGQIHVTIRKNVQATRESNWSQNDTTFNSDGSYIYSDHIYSDDGCHIFGLCKCRPRPIRIFCLENMPSWKLYILQWSHIFGFGMICPRLSLRHSRPPPTVSDVASHNNILLISSAKSSALAWSEALVSHVSIRPLSPHISWSTCLCLCLLSHPRPLAMSPPYWRRP